MNKFIVLRTIENEEMVINPLSIAFFQPIHNQATNGKKLTEVFLRF
jgi:hypothetical protein